MKKSILFCAVMMAGYFAGAQEIVAVTGNTPGKIEFQDFRKINVENPNTASVLLTKSEKINMQNALTEITKICSCGKYIAAMSEADNGNIFYIPMNGRMVTMIDTSAKTGAQFEIPNSLYEPANQATYYARMTTGSDGYIYAVNNAGTEFLRISQNGKVENLGGIVEIANRAKALGVETAVYGGDMIGDAFGNLYLISASAHVFKINPKSLQTDYLGQITGLPEGYTSNGAAVTEDGRILIGTSSKAGGLYMVDFDTLEATFHAEYNRAVTDLSSKYFLQQNLTEDIANSAANYQLFPTVVRNSELNIVSKNSASTVLHVTVWNLSDAKVYSQDLKVGSAGDYKINLQGSLQPGIYILKAVNQNGAEVINTKFTLLR